MISNIEARLYKVPLKAQYSLILAVMCLSMSITDILLPSISDISKDLNLARTSSSILMSPFFLGQLLSVLFWGWVSTRTGYKKSLQLGLATLAISSILAPLTHSASIFSFLRMLQGAGAIASPIIGWAIIYKLYPK